MTIFRETIKTDDRDRVLIENRVEELVRQRAAGLCMVLGYKDLITTGCGGILLRVAAVK